MDEVLNEYGRAWPTDAGARGMPPESPAPMPVQPIRRFDPSTRRKPIDPAALHTGRWRRFSVFGTSLLLAALAVNEMHHVLAVNGLSAVEIVILVLFAINITWITFPFVMSFVGFATGNRRPSTVNRPQHAAPLRSRTALLMPTYNEDPARVASSLDAMAHDIVALGEGHSFDIFILSDTTHGDVALAEHEAVWALRRRLQGKMPVYYRRRLRNTAHKSGNIQDFCERWGRPYDHLVMLDADSLLDGATLVELARRMEANPDAGLIQTLPRLHHGTTLLARLQQFAGSVYGPVLGRGLAWWTGREATFWGHNAILRTRAFLSSAGLPVLPGKPPFGGHILSHDFVEAALIRRGGWSVSIAHDLEGSYEECPSSIVDLAVRDRRWCQGNLQHARVLTANGLHWVSRLHMVAGILSYLASPLWLLFILAGLALGFHYEFVRPGYFEHFPTLFPVWPQMDPVRAMRLFVVTMAVLLGPKIFGSLAILASPRRLLATGGLLFPFSFAFEVVMSAMIAPTMMLIHCGVVADVLAGRDSGWRPQRRDDDSLPWSQVFHRHRWHMVAGAALAAIAWSISWQMLAWLSPAVVPMILSVPVSKLTGSARVGDAIRRVGLLRTPEEAHPPAIARAAEAAYSHYRDALAQTPDLSAVCSDPILLEKHLALTDEFSLTSADAVDIVDAVAEKKILDAATLDDAADGLSPQERARVQARPALIRLLAGRPRRTRPE
jgi:membrane glycosyltransferase